MPPYPAPCYLATGLGRPLSVPQWAPTTNDQLSIRDLWLSSPSTDQRCKLASPTSNCQWEAIRKAIQPSVSGDIKWRVSLSVGFRPSPGGSPASPALDQRVSGRAQGTAWGVCLKCSKALYYSWPSPCGSVNLFPHPCLCDLIAVAVCLGRSLWDLASHLDDLETWGPIGLSTWLPQGWPAGQRVGTWPWGRCLPRPASS